REAHGTRHNMKSGEFSRATQRSDSLAQAFMQRSPGDAIEGKNPCSGRRCVARPMSQVLRRLNAVSSTLATCSASRPAPSRI
ncbi:hypothetical protein BTW07_15895, partial [Salinicola socius]